VRESFPLLRLAASLVSAIVLLGESFAAELPVIRLDTVFPPGGKTGSEVEVAVTGADLDGANGLLFSHPGITAQPKDKRFTIKVAPEVPPGIYDVRVAGLLGVSNPRAFVVGNLPEIATTKPHDKPDAAVELPLDSVFSGSATAAASDYFKFTAKQGQRLIFECAAAEIDSRLSPVLAVLDASGRELEISRGDLLDFTAPADASYLLRLNDLDLRRRPGVLLPAHRHDRSSRRFRFPAERRGGREKQVQLLWSQPFRRHRGEPAEQRWQAARQARPRNRSAGRGRCSR
jgi:hypothetical protein